MDLNSILLWIVGINCAVNLSQSWPIRHQLPDISIRIPVTVLGVLGLTWQVVPEFAGILAAITWGILWVVPLQLFKRVRGLIVSQRYGEAAALSGRISWLYGLFEMAEIPVVAQKLDQVAHQSDPDLFEQEVLPLDVSPYIKSAVGRLALIHLYTLLRQWHSLVEWLQPQIKGVAQLDSATLPAYLRALGEVGDLETLTHTYDQMAVEDPEIRRASALMVLVFGGQVGSLGPLLRDWADFDKVFWLATARMAAGESQAAQTQLDNLQSSHDLNPIQRQLIEWRLAHPPQIAHLSQGSQRVIEQLAQAEWDGLEGSLVRSNQGISWATGLIIGLNVSFFLLEILMGGSTNPQVLIRLGALIPPLVVQGEWWRLVAATVLHYGILHIGLNMLGLMVLAPTVEKALGLWRYGLVYWGSGILSMGMLTAFWAWGLTEVDLVVGASGSIMGLVGSTAAILLWAWLRRGSGLAQKQLRWVGLLVVLQTAFDLSTPEVSFAGHAGGLLAGFLLTTLLLYWQEGSQTSSQPQS
jgi:rhomboid protease GluP